MPLSSAYRGLMFFTAAASMSMMSMSAPSAVNFSASMGWMPDALRPLTAFLMCATRKVL